MKRRRVEGTEEKKKEILQLHLYLLLIQLSPVIPNFH